MWFAFRLACKPADVQGRQDGVEVHERRLESLGEQAQQHISGGDALEHKGVVGVGTVAYVQGNGHGGHRR